MKSKLLKKTLVIAMSAAILTTSAISLTAFAADTESVQTASDAEVTYIEDHSIIDCPNRYKMNDGNFNFTIKVPKGINLSDVTIGFLANSSGVQMYGNTMDSYYGKTLTYIRSDDTYDYYEFISGKRGENGAGINLYCTYNGGYYMATNNANYSTVRGCGYWLDA